MKDGRTNFSELQAALAAGRQEALTVNVFDLLFLEGFDLRDSPLSERKRILKELLEETGVSGPNLKTAKALALRISEAFLLRADEVIE